MPARSKAQQRLFGQAWAVRKGKMDRKDASDSVLKIADSDMTDEQIHDFAATKKLRNHYVMHSKYRKGKNKKRNVKESYEYNIDEDLYILNEGKVKVGPGFDNPKKQDTNKDAHIIRKRPSSLQKRYNNNYANKFEPKLDQNALDKKIFIIIKPGFFLLSQIIIKMFENEGFNLYQTKIKKLTEQEAKNLYRIHEKEDWYKSLCKYMSSDLTLGITFNYNGKWEKALKKTDELKDKIRKKWSESDMRNVMHSSDSLEHMKKESSIYF